MQKEIDALGGGSAGRQHLVQFFRSDKKPSEQKNAKRQRCFEIFPSGNGWKRRLLQGFQIPSYRPMDPWKAKKAGKVQWTLEHVHHFGVKQCIILLYWHHHITWTFCFGGVHRAPPGSTRGIPLHLFEAWRLQCSIWRRKAWTLKSSVEKEWPWCRLHINKPLKWRWRPLMKSKSCQWLWWKNEGIVGGIRYHPCMVYLPTFWLMFMVNVGKYTIHGSYGYGLVRVFLVLQKSMRWRQTDI